MNKLYIKERIQRFSNEELALYVICMSIFLPFYLFLTLFVLYLLFLLYLGKLTPILQSLHKTPFLTIFILYSAVISQLQHNFLGLVCSLMFFLFYLFFRYFERSITPDLFHMILQSFILLSIFAAAFALLEHFQIVSRFNYRFIFPDLPVQHENRAEVTFFNPNYYGISCCFFIMISLYFNRITKSSFWKTLSLFCVIANMVALNSSQSRTAFLAIIAGAIVYLFITIKSSRAFWLSLLFFSIALILLFSSDIGMRMESVGMSFDERRDIWMAGLDMYKSHPILGGGPLAYMNEFIAFDAPYHEHAHSLYIDTLLSYGLVGVGMLFITLIKPLKVLLALSRVPEKRPIVGLVISCFVVIFVHGIFDLAILWVQTSFIFLVIFSGIGMWVGEDTIVFPKYDIHI